MPSEREKLKQQKLKEKGDARRAEGKANKAKNEKGNSKQRKDSRDNKIFVEEFPADFGKSSTQQHQSKQ